jgi:asparagine synthase (glutamine-hydrolysing)
MCGIAGVINLTNRSPVSAERLRAACDALYHRGPDDEGLFAQAGIGLAARRLSIIDLAHGRQPMPNEDGTVHIAYNGEVYNHDDLRRELESLGHVFRTRADTEAVLHGYEEWGPEGLLARLRGMFAFAVWDARAKTLFLARDRMGMKPLYFAEHDGRFCFSSSIRSLLFLSGQPRRIDLGALDAFMEIGFVTAPHTMFDGVRKLPAAHYLLIKNGHVAIRKYWELSYDTTKPVSEAAIVEEFRARLKDCVDTHLMSDVPLGALLSGGVDSTTTVAMMRRAIGKPFRTVTIGFEDEGLDETAWAASSAREIGTEHHSFMFTGDSLAEYPRVLFHQEEPHARWTHAAVYYLFKACRELGLKVVITGEGADELLGGYAWHRSGLVERALSRLPLGVRSTLGASAPLRSAGRASRNLVRALRGLPTRTHDRYRAMIRIGKSGEGRGLLSSDVKSALGGEDSILDSWAEWLPRVENRPEFDQVLWIQSRTRLPDYINHCLDRMSMAHSIEARPPFLDHTLWEFCASIPTGFKMRSATEKYLLRKAGEKLVPEPARIRPKAPLQVPYPKWVARARLPEWAETALGDARLGSAGLFDPGSVRRLRREVQTGEANAALLMGVLTIQLWTRMFIDLPLTNDPLDL